MARRALGRRGGFAAIDVLTTFRLAELLGAPSLHAEGRAPRVDTGRRPRRARSHPRQPGPVRRRRSTTSRRSSPSATSTASCASAGAGSITALARTERGRRAGAGRRRGRPAPAHRLVRRGRPAGPGRRAGRHELPGPAPPPRRPPPAAPAPARAAAAPRRRPSTAPSRSSSASPATPSPTPTCSTSASTLAGGPLRRRTGAASAAGAGSRSCRPRTPTTRSASPSAPSSTPPAAARRSTASPCSTRPSGPTPASSSTTSTPPASRGTAGRAPHVDERMVPRVLVELLDLDRRGLRRSDLMTLLADVPARRRRRHGRADRAVGARRTSRRRRARRPTGRRTSRASPPMSAASDRWDAADDADAARRPAGVRRATAQPTLGDPARHAAAGRSGCAWSTAMLEHWFGPRRLDRLDGAEGRAWEQTSRVLDRLAHLDGIGPPVTRAEFRTHVRRRARRHPGPARHDRRRRPRQHAGRRRRPRRRPGRRARRRRGAAPARPDHRSAASATASARLAGLAASDELTGLVHRQFLAAVTTTPAALVTVPRGDLRATARAPPVALADAVARAGADEQRRRLPRPRRRRHRVPRVARRAPAARAVDRRARRRRRARARLADGDRCCARALALRDARASDRFTAYDGNLGRARTSARCRPGCRRRGSRRGRRARTPTSCATCSACGRSRSPRTIESLSALDRGSALHAAIDRLHRDVLDRAACRRPDRDGWRDEHVAALLRGRRRGRRRPRGARAHRARRVLGQRPQALLAALDGWAAASTPSSWRGGRVLASERGSATTRRCRWRSPVGAPSAFAGSIDRVDELPDGTLRRHRPQDGQAGRPRQAVGRGPDARRRRRFQLPVYAAAARATCSAARTAAVEAGYTFFQARSGG